MLRNTILMTFFVLIIGGCASDGKMQSSNDSSSTAIDSPAVSRPAKSDVVAAESSATNQPNSSKNRIAAGVEEETLNTCLARIPQDATAGQKMLAEQTCQRDFAKAR